MASSPGPSLCSYRFHATVASCLMQHVSLCRLKPWLRRIITRGLAIIPAVIVSAIGGNKAAGKLLILSQVILSLGLIFAVVPLVHFTSSRKKMGRFVNGWIISIIGVIVALIIACLNAYLVVISIKNNEFGNAIGGA